jgi:hypothetical protein
VCVCVCVCVQRKLVSGWQLTAMLHGLTVASEVEVNQVS